MKKGDKLVGNKGTYTILKDFEVTGGMSKVSFARLDKDGKEYFIKEFLSPKYPVDKTLSGSPATIEKKKKNCAEFEGHHIKVNKEISSRSGIGGNLISDYDFFRYGTTYYKVSEKVDISTISILAVSNLPVDQKLLILRTIISSLKILHDIDIVHGDLKQDNILIKELAEGKYVAKLIDFDNSYFSSHASLNSEEVVGTQEYYSPELARYIINNETIVRENLTTKSDVFALGILFSEYWSGIKPILLPSYHYTWQQVMDGKKLNFSPRIPPVLKQMIEKMLSIEPSHRPDLSTLIAEFRGIKLDGLSLGDKEMEGEGSRPVRPPAVEGVLKGKLLEKTEKKVGEKKKEDKKEAEPDSPKLKGKLL